MFMDNCKLFILINVASTSFAQNDYCQEGTYGNNCELDCPKQCRPLQTFPCNKKTGRCSEGCNNGYYGDHCDVTCSCPSGVCFQESGDCIGTGTTTVSTTENTTEKIISTTAAPVFEGVEAGWRTTAIILIVFIILLVCGVVMMILCVKIKRKKIALPGTLKTRFSKAADADFSGDKETGSDLAKTPLMEDNAEVEASGGQDKTTKHGDQSEETSQVFKQPTQVQELKQQIKQLKEEKIRLELSSEGALSRYKYRENDFHSVMGLTPDETNSTYYLMKKDCKWLYCPHLKFDKETVNVNFAQIDDNMVLWNTQDKNPQSMGRRFQHFQGTTCTGPLATTGFYQYFEMVFDISLKQPVGEETVLMQLGFCKEKEDQTPFIEKKNNLFAVEVVRLKDHNSICLVSFKEGRKKGKDKDKMHLQEVMNNVGDSSTQVAIGIHLDKEMKKIVLYDCKQLKVLQKTDIKIDDKIWPMFGVCAENEASVSVQLIAGRDIPMSKGKKQTIRAQM